jgi:hypothetical protein
MGLLSFFVGNKCTHHHRNMSLALQVRKISTTRPRIFPTHSTHLCACARCGASVTYFTLRLLIHYHHPFYYPIFLYALVSVRTINPLFLWLPLILLPRMGVYDVRYCCYDSAANHASYCACLRLINQNVHVSIGMESRF